MSYLANIFQKNTNQKSNRSYIANLLCCALNTFIYIFNVPAKMLIAGIIMSCLQANAVNAHNEVKPESNAKVAIAIHGGAGTILKKNLTDDMEKAYIDILTRSVKRGYELLQQGTDGTIAVVETIKIMEDSPLFNAGVGAVYTFDGEHELDASIMHGAEKQAGAIAGVKTIRNPIEAALLVMQDSPHVMLTGEGAQEFASLNNLAMVENTHFNTTRRYEALQRAKKRILDKQVNHTNKFESLSASELAEYQDYKFGTVGAVVLDKNGNLVAGTSTGGMTAKRYGRVGDSPIIGAGTFADNESCAVSATGHGEYFIRHNVAADICARMKYQNVSLKQASETVMFDVLNSEAGSGGVIAIDSKGNIAMPFNTPGMYRASIDTNGKISVQIFK